MRKRACRVALGQLLSKERDVVLDAYLTGGELVFGQVIDADRRLFAIVSALSNAVRHERRPSLVPFTLQSDFLKQLQLLLAHIGVGTSLEQELLAALLAKLRDRHLLQVGLDFTLRLLLD